MSSGDVSSGGVSSGGVSSGGVSSGGVTPPEVTAPAPRRPDTPYEALAGFADRTQPLVTHYAGPTQRVELSVASVANAVAKAAGLLRDGLGLPPGEAVVSVDLPVHWQLPVWVMAGLTVGAQVGRNLDEFVDVRIVGPDWPRDPLVGGQSDPPAAGDSQGPVDVEGSAEGESPVEGRTQVESQADQVLVSSCDAFGLPLPAAELAAIANRIAAPVLDIGVEARAFPDLFQPEPGAGAAGGVRIAAGRRPEGGPIAAVRIGWVEWATRAAEGLPAGARLWVDERTPSDELLARTALIPLLHGGSVVIGTGLAPADADHIRTVERVSEDG